MVALRCDVHPWIRAWLAVLDHPFFARTTSGGTFRLAGLPAGEYMLAAWHERFGRKELRATVLARQTTDVSFRY